MLAAAIHMCKTCMHRSQEKLGEELIRAIKFGDLVGVQELIASGADVNWDPKVGLDAWPQGGSWCLASGRVLSPLHLEPLSSRLHCSILHTEACLTSVECIGRCLTVVLCSTDSRSLSHSYPTPLFC